MNIKWDANNYTDHFAFVHKYGEDVLELITAPKNSFVVDLGCGNGTSGSWHRCFQGNAERCRSGRCCV